MSCWTGHRPSMSEDQLRQATEAYYKAAYRQMWNQRMQQQWWVPQAEKVQPPDNQEPRRTTSLPEAREVDKAGAIEVEFVRVR